MSFVGEFCDGFFAMMGNLFVVGDSSVVDQL
jgi:hypothetical protein